MATWYDRKRLADLETGMIQQQSYTSIVNMGFLAAESSLVASGSQLWELSVDSDDQTNFLYGPVFTGQVVQFVASRVGGYRTINTSLSFNGSGDCNMIFGASGGFASLVAVTWSGTARWQVEYTNQVSLTAPA